MRVKDVMTRRAETIDPDETLQTAARRMRDLGIGALVVVAGEELAGVITDRDIVVRSTAAGADPAWFTVRSAMTPQVIACSEEDDLEAAARAMEGSAIRRLVVTGAGGRVAGMLSVDDLVLYSRTAAGAVIQRARSPDVPVHAGPWPWWGDEAVETR